MRAHRVRVGDDGRHRDRIALARDDPGDAPILVQGDPAMLRATIAGMGINPNQAQKVQNRLQNVRLKTVDIDKILTPEERNDKKKLIASLEKRLLQSKLSSKQEQTLRDYLNSQPSLNEDAILNAIRLMMSTPEYQLT